MAGYFVRIQSLEGYEKCVRELADDESYKRILSISHKGDKKDPNPHYHITIDTQCKEKAFRKRMTKIFNKGKGNGHMSIKEWDGSDDANAYMFHEDNENANVIVSKGYSQQDISKFIERNTVVKSLVEDAKEKAAYKSEELALAKMKLKMEQGRPLTELEVGIAVYESCLENGKYIPNDFLLKCIVVNIMYKLSRDEDKPYMIKDMVIKALRLKNGDY